MRGWGQACVLVGTAVPLIGAGLGAAYRTGASLLSQPVEGTSRVTSALLGQALSEQSSAALDKLGPQAMLADASPSMQGLAQGVAAKPGPSADMLDAALLERNEGQAGRLAGDLDVNLGPALSPQTIEQSMSAKQAATGPMYDNALSSAPAVDITPASQALENAMLTAKGRNVGRLESAQTDLQAPYRVQGRVVPESDPRALQQAKFAMDEEIARTQAQAGSSASTATRDLTGVRDALNTSMEQQLPGFADANLAWGAAQRGQQAYDAGRYRVERRQDGHVAGRTCAGLWRSSAGATGAYAGWSPIRYRTASRHEPARPANARPHARRLPRLQSRKDGDVIRGRADAERH